MHQLRECAYHQRLGHRLDNAGGSGNRAHCPGQDEGHNNNPLPPPAIDTDRLCHHLVDQQWRVGVDVAHDDTIFGHDIRTEQDFGHVDTVLRAAHFGNRAKMRLV